MDTLITIERKECKVTLSPAAQDAMSNRNIPLVAEVVVTLACCIRKTLNFREPQKDERLHFVTPHLAIALVSGEHKAHEFDPECSLPAIKNWGAIAPRWIAIDFRDGIWIGDFGFSGASRV
jgi:hypothetical protein